MELLRKIIGFPFSLIWWLVSSIRNTLFNTKVFTSQEFDLPVIGVGNLSMGGSGKTPHVEYLIELLHHQNPVSVLSRGYKRKTTGYIFGSTQSTVKQIGDEPLQYKLKYPSVPVAVCESRVIGIPQLLMDAPNTEVVLLDDIFQHRSIKPGLNILLTDYNQIYTNDWLFPAGNLREHTLGAKRADLILVTKCPTNMTLVESEAIRKRINPKSHQQLFFTAYHYGQPYSLYHPDHRLADTNHEVLLMTGIAKPKYLKNYIESAYDAAFLNQFADHHHFTMSDINQVEQIFQNLGDVSKVIMITEKDAVKLSRFSKEFQQAGLPVFIQPIQVKVLFDEATNLNQEVYNFVQNFYHA